jgi:hypothetical protein
MSSGTMRYAADEWVRANEVEDSTREGCVNHINCYIEPALAHPLMRKIEVCWRVATRTALLPSPR